MPAIPGTPMDAIDGANNVYRITLAGQSSGLVKFLGQLGTAELCGSACAEWAGGGGAANATAERCHSYTYHGTAYAEDPRLRGGCYGHTTDNWAPVFGQAGVASGQVRHAPTACSGGAGSRGPSCEHNGICQPSGACACDPGWGGATCGRLALLPVADRAAEGYKNASVSSWGGSIVMVDDSPREDGDAASTGRYHLFAAEMTHGCGLLSWATNSRIVRATSDAPEGPYAFAEAIVEAFAHEPTAVRTPGGGLALFHIGAADGKDAPWTNCSGGYSTGVAPDGDDSSTTCPQPFRPPTVVLAAAPLPSGGGWDWGAATRAVVEGSCGPADLECDTNPAPVIDEEDGSLRMLWRTGATHSCPGPPPGPPDRNDSLRAPGAPLLPGTWCSTMHVAEAADWANFSDGGYNFSVGGGGGGGGGGGDSFGGANIFEGLQTKGTEDAFLWRAADGVYHALFHNMAPWDTWWWHGRPGNRVGRHGWSVDGRHWQYSSDAAYTATVQYADGSNVTFYRRERPHLLLDDARRPVALVTGVMTGVGDRSFTQVQKIASDGGRT